jgi:hypothetical protein
VPRRRPRREPGGPVRAPHHADARFLGIAADAGAGLFPQSGTAADIVVGVLDMGAWPESPSYDDARLREVPSF